MDVLENLRISEGDTAHRRGSHDSTNAVVGEYKYNIVKNFDMVAPTRSSIGRKTSFSTSSTRRKSSFAGALSSPRSRSPRRASVSDNNDSARKSFAQSVPAIAVAPQPNESGANPVLENGMSEPAKKSTADSINNALEFVQSTLYQQPSSPVPFKPVTPRKISASLNDSTPLVLLKPLPVQIQHGDVVPVQQTATGASATTASSSPMSNTTAPYTVPTDPGYAMSTTTSIATEPLVYSEMDAAIKAVASAQPGVPFSMPTFSPSPENKPTTTTHASARSSPTISGVAMTKLENNCELPPLVAPKVYAPAPFNLIPGSDPEFVSVNSQNQPTESEPRRASASLSPLSPMSPSTPNSRSIKPSPRVTTYNLTVSTAFPQSPAAPGMPSTPQFMIAGSMDSGNHIATPRNPPPKKPVLQKFDSMRITTSDDNFSLTPISPLSPLSTPGASPVVSRPASPVL